MSCFRGNRHRFVIVLLLSTLMVRRWKWDQPVSEASHVSHSEVKAVEYPISNILLLGQFNYDVPINRIENWVQIWSKYFSNVSVAGPFPREKMELIRKSGKVVNVLLGKADRGNVSPVENLVNVLMEATPNSGIDAVLYLHDDGLLNLTKFAQGHERIPTDRFIGNLRHYPEMTYSITIPTSGDPIFDIHGNKNTPTTNQTILLYSLPYWGRNEKCLKQRLDMVLHSTDKLKEFGTMTNQGLEFLFPSFTQTDFLLVPKIYATTFARIAEPHIHHGVFLECAFPAIVLWTLMQQYTTGSPKQTKSSELLETETTFVPVCTSWDNRVRGSPEMLEHCLEHPDGYGMFHPIKLSRFRANNFSMWLNRVQEPAIGKTLL